MQRSQLEHLIRAAAEVTNQYEFVVIGSQSILGAIPVPPPECAVSMEADIYPLQAPELADLIDGAIGELSFFHDHFGYYAQGVGPQTARLPRGWQSRLVRLQSQATNGRVGYCLAPVDLFVSKACAQREKDKVFNRALLAHGVVSQADAIARAGDLEDPAEAASAARHSALTQAARPSTPRQHRPQRHPVCDPAATTASGVPATTTRPPAPPPSGPRSMTQSASAITSRSCLMTSTLWPPSTRRCKTLMSLPTSAMCRPDARHSVCRIDFNLARDQRAATD